MWATYVPTRYTLRAHSQVQKRTAEKMLSSLVINLAFQIMTTGKQKISDGKNSPPFSRTNGARMIQRRRRKDTPRGEG